MSQCKYQKLYRFFVDFCDRGEYYNYYKMKPNNGVFTKDFIIKFIDLVKNAAYAKITNT